MRVRLAVFGLALLLAGGSVLNLADQASPYVWAGRFLICVGVFACGLYRVRSDRARQTKPSTVGVDASGQPAAMLVAVDVTERM